MNDIDPSIKEALDYDPLTGDFRWVKTYGKGHKGSIAGSVNTNGYLRIIYKGVRYYAHRLAYWWDTGLLPEEVDHIDRNRLNNKRENLRGTTRSGNGLNKIAQSNNLSTGVIGVTLHRRKSGSIAYRAVFKSKHIGLFSTVEEASKAYNKVKETYINDNQSFIN